MNFGKIVSMVLSTHRAWCLCDVVIGIYLGFKREFSKLIGFLVVALLLSAWYSMRRCERCTVELFKDYRCIKLL